MKPNEINYLKLIKVEVESLKSQSMSPLFIYLTLELQPPALLKISRDRLEYQTEKLRKFLGIDKLQHTLVLEEDIYVLSERGVPVLLFNPKNNEYFAPFIDKKLKELNVFENPDNPLTEEQLVYQIVSQSNNKNESYTALSNWAKANALGDKLNSTIKNKEVVQKLRKL